MNRQHAACYKTHRHDSGVRGFPSVSGQYLVESIEVDSSLVVTDLLRVNVEEDPFKQPSNREEGDNTT